MPLLPPAKLQYITAEVSGTEIAFRFRLAEEAVAGAYSKTLTTTEAGVSSVLGFTYEEIDILRVGTPGNLEVGVEFTTAPNHTYIYNTGTSEFSESPATKQTFPHVSETMKVEVTLNEGLGSKILEILVIIREGEVKPVSMLAMVV